MKLYELFNYYEDPANKKHKFRTPDMYPFIAIGYDENEKGIVIHDMSKLPDYDVFDIVGSITTEYAYEANVKILYGGINIPKTIQPKTPTKLYHLFNHYLTPSNEKDEFDLTFDAKTWRVYYDRGSILTECTINDGYDKPVYDLFDVIPSYIIFDSKITLR